MLKYLSIGNIAVIENAEIELSDGLNVLTGETGAGKSIIIDSINAILGERTSKDLIRFGCEKATVSAVFSNLSKEAEDVLEENGYEIDSDGNLLVLRTFTNSSGSVKINGKTASVGVLKCIAKKLVNIHGQHDSQSLLNPDNHYLYIDKIADDRKELEEYYKEFKNLNAIRKKLNTIDEEKDELLRKKDFLEFQIKELTDADISLGERDRIKEQLEIAESFERTRNALLTAYSAIKGGTESDDAITLVSNASRCLSTVKSNHIKENCEILEGISAELEAVADNIKSFLNQSEETAEDKDYLRERLDLINRLIHKYGDSEDELFKTFEKAKADYETLTFGDEIRNKLADELDLSTERLIELAERLTEKRIKASQKFADDVTKTLKYLDMSNVIFKVSINKGRYTKIGCDEIEFFVKTNVGEDFKPLGKIASGGELSRIMLAIKSVLADKDDVDTLIFDEIDTGVSGFAAGKVGNQLKNVSKSRQVVCVTHLAQIAVCGDNHLKIEKRTANNRTFTSVTPLDYQDRITEIARIMSGTEITDNLYNSAKELLDRSIKNGNL